MENIKRIRCQECGRLLFEVDKVKNLKIKCYKCNKKYIISITNDKIEMKEIEDKE